jgi:hypothetical protein
MSHTLAKVGGFLAVPLLAPQLVKLVATSGESAAPKANPAYVAAGAGVLTFGALAFLAHHEMENRSLSGTVQCLFEGAMYAAGIGAAFSAAYPLISKPGPTISGTNAKADQVFDRLTAKAAAAVADKRQKRLVLVPAVAVAPAAK